MVLKPAREHATNNSQTYFVTSDTWERRALFRNETWARLFFKNLLAHRESYLPHEFALMPDHFHLLISPSIPLERAVQLIKGGFSFRVKREPGFSGEVWHRGFSDHRDAEDYDRHLHYIHLNPVKNKYSSASSGWKLDPIPQWLKPPSNEACGGTTEVVPYQSERTRFGAADAACFPSTITKL